MSSETRDCPTCESGRRMPRKPVCRDCLLHVPYSTLRAWEAASGVRGSEAHIAATQAILAIVARGHRQSRN